MIIKTTLSYSSSDSGYSGSSKSERSVSNSSLTLSTPHSQHFESSLNAFRGDEALMTFFRRFALILAHRLEGGVVTLPGDSGGLTVCGITSKYYPKDVPILEELWKKASNDPQAKNELIFRIAIIYYQNYSNPSIDYLIKQGMYELAAHLLSLKIWGTPGKIAYCLFQDTLNKVAQVHSLPYSIKVDGFFGPNTLNAIKLATPFLRDNYASVLRSTLSKSIPPLVNEIKRLVSMYKSRGVADGYEKGFMNRLIKAFTLLFTNDLDINSELSAILFNNLPSHVQKFNLSTFGRHLEADVFNSYSCKSSHLCNIRTVDSFNFSFRGNKVIV